MLPPEDLQKRILTDFAIYNAEVRPVHTAPALTPDYICCTVVCVDAKPVWRSQLLSHCFRLPPFRQLPSHRRIAGLPRVTGAAAVVVGRGPRCRAVRIRQHACRRRRVGHWRPDPGWAR